MVTTGVPADESGAGIRVLRRGRDAYPAELEDLRDAPPRLWVRGVLPPRPRIAIVGSRAATPYGLDLAERLALDLGRAGFAIVSGFARGIDAAAHRGGLAGSARGVAVIAGGIDRATSRRHGSLSAELLKYGAFVAEQPPETFPHRAMFVQRNRIIAALSDATIVVEAARRSGALSTAAAARRLGRELFAVPGDVDRETSRGCNGLLKDGARVCESAADVVEVVAAPQGPRQRLRDALAGGPRMLASLAAEAGMDEAACSRELLHLEWAGEVRSVAGGRWERT